MEVSRWTQVSVGRLPNSNRRTVMWRASVSGVVVSCALGMGLPGTATGQNDWAQAQLWASDVYQDGLAVWRKPDQFGAACMNCHGPDMFELAYIGFEDDNIIRRALTHVSQEEAETLVAAVHHIRDVYGITPKDQFAFRPFQPGSGVPLAEGASWPEKDAAFAEYLKSIDFPLIDPDVVIDTVPEAWEALHALHAIDPRTLDIGIPLNRWSEDIHHGNEHGTTADWVSDLPAFAADTGTEIELIGLMDAYLQDPSLETLFAYYDVADEGVQTFDEFSSGFLSKQKYLSMQIATHMFRRDAVGTGGFEAQERMAFDVPELPQYYETDRVFLNRIPNPSWEVGDRTRSRKGTRHVGEEFVDYKYPFFVMNGLRPDWAERDHTDAMRVPWFFVGYTFNPTLERISGSNSTKSGEYFSHFGMEDYNSDVPLHVSVYMSMMRINKLLEERAVGKTSHVGNVDTRPWHGLMSNFTRKIQNYQPGRRYGVDNQNNGLPEFYDDAHEEAFEHFTANVHRMFLLIMQDRVRLNGEETIGGSGDMTGRGWPWYMNTVRKADSAALEVSERAFAKLVQIDADGVYCAADSNANGVVEIDDLIEVLRNFGRTTAIGDIDASGIVEIEDILLVLTDFGTVCSDLAEPGSI